MPQYRYQALDDLQRPVAGEFDAETVSQAITALEARGLVVQSIIRATAEPSSMGLAGSQAPAASSRSIASGSAVVPVEPGRQELQSLLAKAFQQGPAAAPILRAYAQDVLSGGQRQELEQVVGILETGDLEQATDGFRGHAQWWLPLLGALAKASTPGSILEGFVQRLDSTRERRRQWWLVLVYPLFLTTLIFAVLTIMSVFVVPTFAAIFDDFATATPFTTTALLVLSVWLRSWWVVLLIGVLTTCLVLIVWGRVWPERGRKFVNQALAVLPAALTPRRLRSLWIGRFAAYVAHLLEAGEPIPSALRVAALTVERPADRSAARRLADAMERDLTLHDPSVSERLSSTVVYAVQTPLPSSAQIQLLREIRSCQFEQTSSRSGLIAATGPIAVVVVGLMVGWMLLALFAPLVQLVSDLSG